MNFQIEKDGRANTNLRKKTFENLLNLKVEGLFDKQVGVVTELIKNYQNFIK